VVVVLLLSPRGDQAYAGAMAFTVGTAGCVLFAAVIEFAVLPGFATFPAFCVALGLCLIPVGFVIAQSRQPAMLAVATAMGFNFVPAEIKLMGYNKIVRGHVAGVARAINVPNAQPNQQGLADVNPIFTWVRLAQRVPVRIRIDQVPDGVRLVAGMTATVQVDARAQRPSK
jgi:hypothetical protein